MEALKKGREYLNEGRLNDARMVLEPVRKAVPDCVDAYEIIGISYLRQGDCEQAEKALRRAHQLDPQNSNILNNLGNALYRQTKLDASIDAYKQALALPNQESYKLLVNLANSYADEDKIDDARSAFSDAIKARPDFAPAYLGLGRMYFEHKQTEEAERAIRHAIEFKSDYANAYFYLGQILMRKSDYPNAVIALKTSLKYETNPKYIGDTKILLQRAEAQAAGASNPPPVAATAAPAVPAVPETVDVALKDKLVADANQLLKNRNWQEAQGVLEQIMKKFGTDDPIVWNNLGYARVHQGKPGSTRAYDDAIADYKQAIKLKKGGFPTAQYNLGQAYRLLDDRKYAREAEAAFRQAIEDARLQHTMCPLAQCTLGMMLKQRRDYKGADSAFRRAIAQSGTELPVAHFDLAILLEQHEDKSKEAVREYKAYLSLAPNGLNAKAAHWHLDRLLGK
jgi:tetratricopeptide (TPR) repeat protein